MAMSWFRSRRDDRAARRLQERRRRFAVESLEGRQMLSTFTVTSNADSTAAGTLRWAITESNDTPATATAPNVIDFDLAGKGAAAAQRTISVGSQLPTITQPVTINATTETGYAGVPIVAINGTNAGSSAVGLYIESNHVTVEGLDVMDFNSGGIAIDGGAYENLAFADTLSNDWVGLDLAANVAGNGTFGVELRDGAFSNTLTGVVVAGNTYNGIVITGSSDSNVVQGSFIGTDNTGVDVVDDPGNSLGNGVAGGGGSGIVINDNSNDNLIGGTTTAARDDINNNESYGVYIVGASSNKVEGDVIDRNDGPGVAIVDSSHTTVSGDDIGTDSTGSERTDVNGNFLGNSTDGVLIDGGSTYNTIGGTTTAARNLIDNSAQWGVYISDSGTSDNLVEGNDIGVNAAGTGALPNAYNGLDIVSGASGNTVGGTTSGSGNVISGNTNNGVDIAFSGASGNLVEGNFIGTNAGDTAALPNGVDGVVIQGGATDNTVGGTTSAARNVISGNSQAGVVITDSGTSGNVVEGDDIGTNAGGTAPIGNGYAGVIIQNTASYNTVGGTVSGSSDVISANGIYGVLINGSDLNVVAGDFIGTNDNGTSATSPGGAPLGNNDGVDVENGSAENTIGGTTTAALDVISGNANDGVQLSSSGPGNVVEGDYIGTNVYGTGALPNGRDGVMIQGGSYADVIGGLLGDLIAYNEANGVQVTSGCSDNTIDGDTIEYNNDNGVWLDGDSYDVVEGSFIGGNGEYGILDTGSNNTLVDNTIFDNNGLGGVGY
jgi:hypothetical protein